MMSSPRQQSTILANFLILDIMNDKHIEKIRKILDKYLVSYIHNILLTTNMILSYTFYRQKSYSNQIKLYLKDIKMIFIIKYIHINITH